MSGLSKSKTIECYQLIEEIGKGAYGKVYKGINLNNGIFVAMKEIHISKQHIRTIKKQINVLKSLNHKNIVRYEDAIIKDHKIYLILEYLEGGSLGMLCKRSIFPESLIKLYVHQVLEGLEYLHKLNIVHRDIKGLNLLLTKEGKLKIADFGVAVNISQNQKTLSAGGSPYWMAPETINGQELIHPKIDIWSLGCTVIELITGSPPYVELGPLPALLRIAEDVHPPLPKNASAECVDFLLRCFEKEPEKRACAAELLEHKWMKTVNEQQINLQRSHKNIRSSNVLLIQSTLKSGNLHEILSLSQKTENKKLIYYNKNFLVLNEVQNSDLKVQLLHVLINSDFEAYKYIESIGIIKNMFTRECKTVRMGFLKALEFIRECYILGFQNDTFFMIQNNVIYYIAMLCKQYLTKKEMYLNYTPVAELLCAIIRSFTHDQLILSSHILQILQEENTLNSLSICYHFAVEYKNTEIATSILLVFNKYTQENFEISEALDIFQYSLRQLCNICVFQNDIKASQENIKLVLFLSKYQDFQEAMETTGLSQCLSEYAKLLVINKNVCEDHTQSVNLYLQLMVQFFFGRPQRNRSFMKAGGIKRLRSLPKFLIDKGQINQKINLIINQLNIQA